MQRWGDRAWRQTLDRHDRAVEEALRPHRGRLIKSTGDRVLCIFDGPVRAIAAARALIERLRDLDLQIRVALHTGEVEPRHGDVTGLAVHVAARLLMIAQPNEILVTRTLADLVAGADVSFSDRAATHSREFRANGNCCRWRQTPEEALHEASEKGSSAVPH